MAPWMISSIVVGSLWKRVTWNSSKDAKRHREQDKRGPKSTCLLYFLECGIKNRMELEKLQNNTIKTLKTSENIFPTGTSVKIFQRYDTIPPLSASKNHLIAINSASDPAASFKNALWCKRREKALGFCFLYFVPCFLLRQRTHPGQHHKRSDRHHKWLNSQWLHLEGKGGGGQGRGCLTGPGCQKRSFKAEKEEMRGGRSTFFKGYTGFVSLLARLSPEHREWRWCHHYRLASRETRIFPTRDQ